jgi:hypothetical protein
MARHHHHRRRRHRRRRRGRGLIVFPSFRYSHSLIFPHFPSHPSSSSQSEKKKKNLVLVPIPLFSFLATTCILGRLLHDAPSGLPRLGLTQAVGLGYKWWNGDFCTFDAWMRWGAGLGARPWRLLIALYRAWCVLVSCGFVGSVLVGFRFRRFEVVGSLVRVVQRFVWFGSLLRVSLFLPFSICTSIPSILRFSQRMPLSSYQTQFLLSPPRYPRERYDLVRAAAAGVSRKGSFELK